MSKPKLIRHLTPAQREEFKLLYPHNSNKVMAALFGLSAKKCLEIGCNMDLRKEKREWTDQEKKFLIDNYNNMTTQRLANDLERPYWGVVRMIKKLGLCDPPELQTVDEAITHGE